MLRTLSFIALPLFLVAPAAAADLRSAKASAPVAPQVAEVPGGDIFGFTSGTDVGKPGDKGLALETNGSWGIADGRYRGIAQKLEFSSTLADNWAFAGSLFGTWSSLKNNSTFNDRSSYSFDGISFEVRHRLIERGASNPFALTLALEPRWSRVDAISGRNATAYGAEFKAQIDAPVSDRLFWAANANFATTRGRDAETQAWGNGSASALSTALTYSVVDDKFFVGAEARWQQAWSKSFFGNLDGQALYFGPTFAFKPADNIMINAVLLPQIAGKARNVSGPFDLDNFQRANYRLKLAIGF